MDGIIQETVRIITGITQALTGQTIIVTQIVPREDVRTGEIIQETVRALIVIAVQIVPREDARITGAARVEEIPLGVR